MIRILDWIAEGIRSTEGAPESLTITYLSMNENLENAMGIFIYEGVPEPTFITGTSVLESIKIHMEFQATKDKASAMVALNWMRKVVDTVLSMETQPDGFSVVLELVGPKAIPIGTSEGGVPTIASNIQVRYVQL